MSMFSLMPEGHIKKLKVGGGPNKGGFEGGPDVEVSPFGMDNLKSAGKSLGAGLAKGMADKALGEGTGDILAAGMQSGFNPYVMAGAAILGVAKSRAEKKRQRRMGEARADQERAEGEQKKSDIYGQMAQSIRGSLGGAQRKRSVNL